MNSSRLNLCPHASYDLDHSAAAACPKLSKIKNNNLQGFKTSKTVDIWNGNKTSKTVIIFVVKNDVDKYDEK